jgi:hypothetical protein
MPILLLTLIAHTLTDFIFQTDRMIAGKEQFKAAGFFGHGGILFALLILFLQGYRLLPVAAYSLTITLIHLGIDYLKAVKMRETKRGVTDFTVFLIDQALHFLTIFLVWQWFDLAVNPGAVAFYGRLFLRPKLLAALASGDNLFLFSLESILLWVLAYLAVCWGGSILIRKFLNSVAHQNGTMSLGPVQDHTVQRAGKYIGILERMLILTFVLNHSLTAVAFVFTAKSIARFNELDNREFAEYYLVGTLSSTALAVLGGLAVNALATMIM